MTDIDTLRLIAQMDALEIETTNATDALIQIANRLAAAVASLTSAYREAPGVWSNLPSLNVREVAGDAGIDRVELAAIVEYVAELSA